MSLNPSVTLVTKFDPYATSSGGASRTRAVVDTYREAGHEVEILSLGPPAQRPGHRSFPPARAVDVGVGTIRHRTALAGRYFSPALRRHLSDGSPDRLHVEYTHMLVNVPTSLLSRSHVDCHNVESELAAQLAAHERRPAVRRLLAFEAARLQRFEQRALRRAGRVTVCSDQDAARLASWGVVATTLPNGFTPAVAAAPQQGHARSAMFVASLGWLPNHRAAMWLVRDIWPLVRAARPDATLRLVGGGSRPELREAVRLAGEGVELLGFVDDLAEVYRDTAVSVAPLLEGSGTRLKVLESLGYGVPVVSTPIGAEGIDVGSSAGLVRATSTQEFARTLVSSLDQPPVVDVRAVATRYSWDAAMTPLREMLHD